MVSKKELEPVGTSPEVLPVTSNAMTPPRWTRYEVAVEDILCFSGRGSTNG
jgi:hypothetical protein